MAQCHIIITPHTQPRNSLSIKPSTWLPSPISHSKLTSFTKDVGIPMSTTVTSFLTPAARVAGPPGQPDIEYAPNFAKYQARTARRLAEENLQKALPEGFPERLTGDLVWAGETLTDTYDWTYVLSEEQLEEIEVALRHFKCKYYREPKRLRSAPLSLTPSFVLALGLPLGHISAETFPLPNLHAEFRRLSDELHSGHGFFVIRGLRVESHTRADNMAIYAGISSYIAPQRGRQDSKINGKPADVVLTHIKDLSESTESKGVIGSPAYTADKQVFHTDSGDIVSLFALETASEGGASKLASTWRVYNELASTRPDLVHTLAEDWDLELSVPSLATHRTPPNSSLRFGDQTRKYGSRPLLYHQPATDSTPERILLQYARRYFVGFGALPRSPAIPPITEAQAEALDALHFLGERFCVSTGFERGDIQYVNNLAVFHARDGYRDTEEKR